MFVGSDLVRIIEESFLKARCNADLEQLKKKCYIQTAHFTSNIGITIYEQYYVTQTGYILNKMKISEDGKWLRKEFLVDSSITKTTDIYSKSKKKMIPIHASMCWAIESVTDPTLTSFGKHFGKLMCVKSEHYLFLNAITQRTKSRRAQYIQQRLTVITELLNTEHLSLKSCYIAFWPSPHDHQWDNFSPEILLNWIEVYELTQNPETLKYEFIKLKGDY